MDPKCLSVWRGFDWPRFKLAFLSYDSVSDRILPADTLPLMAPSNWVKATSYFQQLIVKF